MKIILDVATQFMGPLTQGIECKAVRLVEQPDGSFGLLVMNDEAKDGEARPRSPGGVELPGSVKELLCQVCGKPLIAHSTPCV